MQVNILEAKNQLSQLIKHAQAGAEVVIANRGAPVARLVATTPQDKGQDEPGSAARWRAWLQAHPLPAHVRTDHAAIEAAIAAERAAWD